MTLTRRALGALTVLSLGGLALSATAQTKWDLPQWH